ncbi:MAG: ParB family chromosome partitioning protein [Candidatus Promineifilaceae bacterium]|jgi:ParB family transcriptional regulator, chromosome partitioning protein
MAKHGLGRGLDALIKGGTTPVAPTKTDRSSDGLKTVPLESIARSPFQPRKHFDENALDELRQSIAEHGILQPLVVRRTGDTFELIAGERRLRAAGLANLKVAPVVIVDVPDQNALELALIENVQRENLNVIEEAQGYKALADTFNLTQEDIAKRVGKGRATVANALRILELPDAILDVVRNGSLSAGHAKVLLSLDKQADRLQLAKRAVEEGLSVRNLEKLAKQLAAAPRKPRVAKSDVPASHLNQLSDRLHQHFGTSVRIEPTKTHSNGKKKKGYVQIDLYSNDDLDRVLTLLGVSLD